MKLFLLVMISISQALAQSVTYPLDIGDRWEFAYAPLTGGGTFSTHVAIDTLLPNGKTYAMIVNDQSYAYDFERQVGDSVFVFHLGLNAEVLFYDFSRSNGDTVTSVAIWSDTMDIVLQTSYVANLFGAPRRAWVFWVDRRRHGIDDEYTVTVADSIGVIGTSPSFGDPYGLKGALINGRVYGTIAGVGIPYSADQKGLTVLQNYPNPFNPNTTIRFHIATSVTVRINVYTVLGQIIAAYNLPNLLAGDHELHVDGSSWSTGAYYYRISSGDVSQTRKMLLQK